MEPFTIGADVSARTRLRGSFFLSGNSASCGIGQNEQHDAGNFSWNLSRSVPTFRPHLFERFFFLSGNLCLRFLQIFTDSYGQVLLRSAALAKTSSTMLVIFLGTFHDRCRRFSSHSFERFFFFVWKLMFAANNQRKFAIMSVAQTKITNTSLQTP